MSGIAITPSAIMNDTLATARRGVTPAIIGAAGAGIGLYYMAAVFASASIPMSVLGIVLGLHSRNVGALGVGALAVVCALVGLLNSDVFWLGFAVLAGAIGTG